MTRVPLYREYSTSYATNGKRIDVEHMTVFGWKVLRHVMQPGSKLVTHTTVQIPRDLVPNRSMYVRGRATCVTDGTRDNGDRVPGIFSHDRGPHPAGQTVTTALEETEFWCFNYSMNKRSLPDLTPVRVQAGQTFYLAASQLLFVMHGVAGDLKGPMQYVPDQNETITADTDLYGFIFSAGRT